MWLKYGRKIIDIIFKRKPKCSPVCSRIESRIEADSDRSDIGMFEIGLSAEQLGNYEHGTGTSAQEEEGNRLVSIAKRQGLFISKEEWPSFGERKRTPSGESIIYLDKQGIRVIKVRNPFAKSAIKQMHATDAIYEHLIHNLFFPDTRYHFEGISEDVDGVRIVLSQEYFSDKFILPTQKQIDCYLIEGLGMKPENKYFYGNDYVSITDVSAEGDNVLTDGEKLYFIDPIIKLKRPAIEILGHYYDLME